MLTFHTGGVASSADITQGLPRVEELFESRTPKTEALMAPVSGVIGIMEVGNKKVLRLEGDEETTAQINVPKGAEIKIEAGAKVKRGDVLMINKEEEVKAAASGTIDIEGSALYLTYTKKQAYEFQLTSRIFLRVQDGDTVERGQQLTEGQLNLKDLMALKGVEATQRYIIDEIQKIYNLQGQNISDKHIEIAVRQMFSKVRIDKDGDSDLAVGDVTERLRFNHIAGELVAQGKTPPTATQLLLGVTKASLNTESFLSAASFQETTRILVDAAVAGKVDYLKGLKENVIVGRLIPAGTGFREYHSVAEEVGPTAKDKEDKIDNAE
jgi:DNA-directed RNA polymerase subunit beta'